MYSFFKILILTGIILSCFSSSIAIAESPAPVPVIEVKTSLTPKELVHLYALKYHVSEHSMRATIACESNWNPNEVGDAGQSFGLSQIYLPAHLEVTKTQALDPTFAVEFMAKNFSHNNGNIWTCYRWLKAGIID